MPDSMIAAISSVVPTGRRMKVSETFIAPLHRRAAFFSLAAPARYWPPLGGGDCEPSEFCVGPHRVRRSDRRGLCRRYADRRVARPP